jgi:hypothetical protein
MFVQVRFQSERLPTSTTHMGLSMRMRLHVCAQIRLIGECLCTNGALERLLPWNTQNKFVGKLTDDSDHGIQDFKSRILCISSTAFSEGI